MAKKPTKKQTEIPGTEHPDAIPELDEIAGPLAATRYERMDLQEKEGQLSAQMDQAMEARRKQLSKDKNGVPVYVFRDAGYRYNFRLKETSKVTIERVADE